MRHPKMIWELCRLMVNRMARASELVEEQAFQPITGRLARLLLDTFESAGGISVARYLTLDEMAARIGTTREMVCRVLYQFSDQELIEVTRTEFMLLNKADLHKLAEQG
jgi:CRP/FNR family transcriptional regulator